MEPLFVEWWNSMFNIEQLIKDYIILAGLTGISIGVIKKAFQ